jgi:membrane-bound lytic murein transglycosylase MltF
MADDSILASIRASGCGAATAAAERVAPGVDGSRRIAQIDLARVDALKAKFEAAAAATGMPRALLAAIASRESHCGAILDHNSEGDGGEGFGIMQVDRRSHQQEGRPDPRSQAHIDQASGILADGFRQMQQKFPSASEAEQLRAAVAAYNCGSDGVHSIASPDGRTTTTILRMTPAYEGSSLQNVGRHKVRAFEKSPIKRMDPTQMRF